MIILELCVLLGFKDRVVNIEKGVIIIGFIFFIGNV